MADIAKGMVVQLISGGPLMSVVDVSDYSRDGMGAGPSNGAKCVWFDAKKIKCEDVFDVAVLREYSAPKVDFSR